MVCGMFQRFSTPVLRTSMTGYRKRSGCRSRACTAASIMASIESIGGLPICSYTVSLIIVPDWYLTTHGLSR